MKLPASPLHPPQEETHSAEAKPKSKIAPVGVTMEDFIPLPAKALKYRGVTITRATAIRAIKAGVLKSRLFRQPGSTQGRRYLLRESLDAYIEGCMVESPLLPG